ncbi:MAG: GNAT family N-acetyltransferase [Flavobacteriaceae bacterium]
MNFTFRPAKYSDLELTYQLKKDELKKYVEKIWGWDEKKQTKLHENNFDPKNTKIILLENNNVGYWTEKVSDSEIYIENLIIGEKFQNNGFGTKVMNWLIKEAENKKKSIALRVLKENKRAKKFYENLGFEKISESENHYEMKKTGYV